jgi:hypothetical protein
VLCVRLKKSLKKNPLFRGALATIPKEELLSGYLSGKITTLIEEKTEFPVFFKEHEDKF